MNVTKQKMRILVVEDSHSRFGRIEAMFPHDARSIWTSCGATALSVLERDRGETFSGIMLDFDLDQSLYNVGGPTLTGEDVAQRVVKNISRDTPILVHSMNPSGRQKLVSILTGSGFSVTQIPMGDLTKEKFDEWINECREVQVERDVS